MERETGETLRWSTFFICCAVALCGLIYAVYDFNIRDNQMEREIYELALDKGYPPLTVKCALDHSYAVNNEVSCILIALRGDELNQQQIQELYER